MSARQLAREWLPPVLHRAIGRATGRSTRFVAQAGGWSQAMASSKGYSDEAILERVARATREVLAGRAAFERDSVLFHEPAHPFQILAPLLRHALLHDGKLEVIDFGGSLGSTYRQCLPFLPPLAHLGWHVVEQAQFVAAGKAEFAHRELHFHPSIEELPALAAPPLLLASSVLQYMAQPDALVDAWTRSPASTLVIDRTPLSDAADHVLCLQHVPRWIYDASYPCWILSRERLMQQLGQHWDLLATFDCPEGSQRAEGGSTFAFEGLVLERRKP